MPSHIYHVTGWESSWGTHSALPTPNDLCSKETMVTTKKSNTFVTFCVYLSKPNVFIGNECIINPLQTCVVDTEYQDPEERICENIVLWKPQPRCCLSFSSCLIQEVSIDSNLISTNANRFGGLEGIVRDYSVMHGRPGFLCYFNTAVHYEEKSFLSTCLLWQQ